METFVTGRKSAVLGPSTLACLSDAATINVTLGCTHCCALGHGFQHVARFEGQIGVASAEDLAVADTVEQILGDVGELPHAVKAEEARGAFDGLEGPEDRKTVWTAPVSSGSVPRARSDASVLRTWSGDSTRYSRSNSRSASAGKDERKVRIRRRYHGRYSGRRRDVRSAAIHNTLLRGRHRGEGNGRCRNRHS